MYTTGRNAPRAAWADRAAIHPYTSRGSRRKAASQRHPESSPVFAPFDTEGAVPCPARATHG